MERVRFDAEVVGVAVAAGVVHDEDVAAAVAAAVDGGGDAPAVHSPVSPAVLSSAVIVHEGTHSSQVRHIHSHDLLHRENLLERLPLLHALALLVRSSLHS